MAHCGLRRHDPAARDPVAKNRFVPFEQLTALLREIFLAHGTSASVADRLALNCASAERDGAASHGVFRMPGYVSTLDSGWVDGRAIPVVDDVAAAFVKVDARNGFAQPALAAATSLAIAKTRDAGACVVGIHGSHHFGALWLDVEPFAEQGLVALSMVNSMAVVVAHGGKRPVYGTNPMAFAVPRGDRLPLVFDQAASTMAHGDVTIAAREGRLLPEGAGVDADGRPTRDPNAVLDGGALQTFGGHKGSSIAMMIEILSAALSGGRFSFEVDWSAHPGAQTPCTGQCLILIDPAKAGSLAAFTRRVEDLLAALHEAGQERLPGDRRYASRRRAARDGIPMPHATIAMIEALSRARREG